MSKKRTNVPKEKAKSRRNKSKGAPQKRTQGRSALAPRSKKATSARAYAASRARKGRPIDESRIDEVPPLRPVDSSDFDRIVAVCTSKRGREAAVRLATWFCGGLKALPPSDRRGVAYVQIDEPLNDDLKPFQENIFFPSEAIVACVTGQRAFVHNICVRASKPAGKGIMAAGRFAHCLTTLPVWAVVTDDNLIIPEGGYFQELEQGLRERGWKVWVVEPNIYSMAWGVAAEEALAKLPLAILERSVARPSRGHAQLQDAPDEPAEVPAVDAASQWLLILLRKKSGSTDAEWVVVFQAEEDDPDEEVDVRAWYYRLFEDEEPWIIVPEGMGAASRIETAFTPDAFVGMPRIYRFEKAPTTRMGSLWTLTTQENLVQGQFVVERMALVSGRELNELDRALNTTRDVPVALRTIGTPLERWVFGKRKTLHVPCSRMG
ncbi:hypothetical protein [Anaeromyxobacter oryzisoli]|uniref:hypothetical protein n=1 Tax=Anaeromyxobacter oryzisoli TaxID=2925408 RepID=UPI001F569ABD|nr:hypothetical protein [Anaeromyxobacter sp. SG63]